MNIIMLYKYPVLVIIIAAASIVSGYSQPAEYKMTQREYIDRYKDEAIREMLMNGVPASITLAQGMLESANGNSPLAVYANNHFGIKCHKGWQGLTFIQDDDTRNECFRKYSNVLDSYSDHSTFLNTRGRYSFLFELKRTDYKGWARGLKKAGYATNPKYPVLLIKLIEKYKLYEYDHVKEMPSLMPEPEEYASKPMRKGRKVLVHNRVKYIIVKDGDTYFEIANNLDMMLWQIYKYNDLKRNDHLRPGQVIYLQPKRKKANKDYEYHIAKRGETMYRISQKYAVKIKSLYKMNRMVEGEQPSPGQRIHLRKPIKAPVS